MPRRSPLESIARGDFTTGAVGILLGGVKDPLDSQAVSRLVGGKAPLEKRDESKDGRKNADWKYPIDSIVKTAIYLKGPYTVKLINAARAFASKIVLEELQKEIDRTRVRGIFHDLFSGKLTASGSLLRLVHVYKWVINRAIAACLQYDNHLGLLNELTKIGMRNDYHVCDPDNRQDLTKDGELVEYVVFNSNDKHYRRMLLGAAYSVVDIDKERAALLLAIVDNVDGKTRKGVLDWEPTTDIIKKSDDTDCDPANIKEILERREEEKREDERKRRVGGGEKRSYTHSPTSSFDKTVQNACKRIASDLAPRDPRDS